jgi:hypothetical protein
MCDILKWEQGCSPFGISFFSLRFISALHNKLKRVNKLKRESYTINNLKRERERL